MKENLTIGFIGNPNCGKTTLFNQLTGSNQHVGNFPGVTVDKKEGSIRRHPEATVTDLPGIYSLSPYSSEEIVTRDFLLNEKNEIFCLEANTLPGMTPTSLIPQEAKVLGMDYPTLCEELIRISLKKYE